MHDPAVRHGRRRPRRRVLSGRRQQPLGSVASGAPFRGAGVSPAPGTLTRHGARHARDMGRARIRRHGDVRRRSRTWAGGARRPLRPARRRPARRFRGGGRVRSRPDDRRARGAVRPRPRSRRLAGDGLSRARGRAARVGRVLRDHRRAARGCRGRERRRARLLPRAPASAERGPRARVPPRVRSRPRRRPAKRSCSCPFSTAASCRVSGVLPGPLRSRLPVAAPTAPPRSVARA